jgi:uncharacterized protein YkwD
MKKILAILGIMAVAGCHQDRHGGGGSAHDPWYITYSNGHPIAAEAESNYILDHENEMIDLINVDRALTGLNVLVQSPDISDVARAHSIHMAISDFEGAYNPEGDGPEDRADLAGFFFTRYGENTSAGLFDPVDVFNNWMLIPGMHDNLHDFSWDWIGCGYEEDVFSTFGHYWTVDFLMD